MSAQPLTEDRSTDSCITETDSPSSAAMRYNIVITWNSTTQTYAVSPVTTPVPPGFGMGNSSLFPSPAYLKWYVIPSGGDTVTFNNNPGSQGITFTNPPAGLTIQYDSGNLTASAQWSNSLGSGDSNASYAYTVSLLVNGSPVGLLDPDVENQAPPG